MKRGLQFEASALASATALIVLTGVWTWWAVAEGAYFGAVLLPGVLILACGLLLVTTSGALPGRLSFSRLAWVALAALGALAAWSALSALWSPAPDVAVEDGLRVMAYVLAFALGLLLAARLERRLHLALIPLALAGGAAGIFAVLALLTGSDSRDYLDAGTLEFPLAYRNANAAFFLLATWPAIGLATTRELDWRLRALALGAATLCIELAMLSQSRGSMPATALALAVFFALSPSRGRAAGWLALAIVPALIVVPSLADLFQTRELDDYTGTAEIRAAGRAVLVGAGVAMVAGAIAALLGRRMTPSAARERLAHRWTGVAALAGVLAGIAAFVVATGDPVEWVDDRVDEFLTEGTPNEQEASRFVVDAGGTRDDLWRVALEEARGAPLLGTGGGGYHHAYLLERDEEGLESVHDAHSVPLEVLSELGYPGLCLFALAVVAAIAGAWRSRRVSRAAAALSAVSVTAVAYWLAHASLDWFWAYPAVTAPVFALLGSACGASAQLGQARPTRLRRAAAIGAAIVALCATPIYLSERYVDAAYDEWRSDADRADEYLALAQDFNPLSIEPIIAEAAIAREAGDRGRAITAFERAVEERPEEWASRYFLAELHLRSDPARARAELREAQRLNPLSEDLMDLADRLQGRSKR